MTDMTNEKPLEGADRHAQDSPTPQQNVWEAKHDVGTEARHRKPTTRKVFVSFSRTQSKVRNQAFAAALRDAMTKAGVNPSEVARRVWGTTKDKRGVNVAKNHDRISHYLNGTSYPAPENLERLATAVGLTVEELAGAQASEEPTAPRSSARPQGSVARHTAINAGAATGELVLTSLPAQPTKIRLQVDRVIHWKLAARIQAMLKEAETGEVVEDDGPQPGDVIQGGAATQ
jgi:transcriptional regulator with XRE-family HTH domain